MVMEVWRRFGKAVISLLFVSLLHVLDKDDDDEEDDHEELLNFTAKTHTSYIRDVMRYFYNIDMNESD